MWRRDKEKPMDETIRQLASHAPYGRGVTIRHEHDSLKSCLEGSDGVLGRHELLSYALTQAGAELDKRSMAHARS